ncbi:fumarylacetoacetate hydrolase family protein [Paenibacillus abyssi]|uniref:Fumarylacetoacetate hydrolase n=1 Tax=Paenibacillus abyssi TaxID=1340531 RepID=A0A917LGT5_9BACL|nr:fumarylacetoacetate hydrolase family protein [Paenibacillus abyssi]GGG23268.1 fumarylacetoacetate hydrolase [Paenibacillus abyssi]
MNDICNVYCIGRNYRLHALELGNEVPQEPLVFQKPSHSLVPMDGRVIELPGDRGAVHFEVEIVLRIGKSYTSGTDVDNCVDAMALGLDLTLREVQDTLKRKGLPWLAAKGFLGSAPIGPWMSYPGAEGLKASKFALLRNGQQVQLGNAADMLFPVAQLIEYIGSQYGLGAGDVIFTGTPAGVGALQDGDRMECLWDGKPAGSCLIKLG